MSKDIYISQNKSQVLRCHNCNQIEWCEQKERIYWNSLYSYRYCKNCGLIRNLKIDRRLYAL